MIEILNDTNFSKKVLQAQGKIFVEFFATWCPHCQRMMPIVERLAEDLSGKVAVYQVDVDQSPDLANKYAPDGFPTFDLFENGNLIAQTAGEQSETALKTFAAQ